MRPVVRQHKEAQQPPAESEVYFRSGLYAPIMFLLRSNFHLLKKLLSQPRGKQLPEVEINLAVVTKFLPNPRINGINL